MFDCVRVSNDVYYVLQGHDSPTREELEGSGAADNSEVCSCSFVTGAGVRCAAYFVPYCMYTMCRFRVLLPDILSWLLQDTPRGPSGRLGDSHVSDTEGTQRNARPGEFAPNDPAAPEENTPENARNVSS